MIESGKRLEERLLNMLGQEALADGVDRGR